MRCPNCDLELTEGTIICPKCRTKIREKTPLLISQPAIPVTESQSKSGSMPSAVRAFATIMLIIGIIGVVISAFLFGMADDTFTYLGRVYGTGARVIVPEVFWPVIIGGGLACAVHFIFWLAVADALEKLGDIRYHLMNLRK